MCDKRLSNRGIVSRQLGMSLVELLSAVAVVAVLAALMLPVWGRMRDAAMQTQCSSNLRVLALAGQLYVQDHNGYFSDDGIFYASDYTDSSGRKRPGLADYVEIGSRSTGKDTVFTCPALQLSHETTGFNSNHNYAVNVNATAGFALDEDGNNFRRSDSKNFYQMPFPEQIVFLMDGRPGSEDHRGHYYATNVAASTISGLVYPHRGANNVVYFSGRVERLTREELERIPVEDAFWTGGL